MADADNSNRALTVLSRTIPALPYQVRWIKDDSQLKIAVWSRQSGKSFAAALRAVIKCLGKRTRFYVLSKGERQSREFMEKVKDFCQVMKVAKLLPEFVEVPETDEKVMEVQFPHNGSRILGLPANPDTARGFSGNLVLDEFAFHGDARKIFAACFPIITRGYSIEVISTPNGTAGKFYEIAKEAGLVGVPIDDSRLSIEDRLKLAMAASNQKGGKSVWSGHKVDIYDAKAQGLNANIELLKSGCDDEETWLQEYCCEFLSDAANYIPIELISTCVHSEATDDADYTDLKGRELYLGVDIGRKRDLTIMWLFEKLGDVLWSRVIRIFKGVTFDVQEKALNDLLDLEPRRCGIDQNGIGMQMAERATQKYGAMVEPIQFTMQFKDRLAPLVKTAFEDRTVRIPDNRDVRADINSVKRFVTPAGNVRFDAEHTDRGHADRFWALAMVVNAASTPNASFADGAIGGQTMLGGFVEAVL